MSTAPLHPQQLAEAVGQEFYRHDAAVQALGMALNAIGPGTAEFAMTVRADMVNSHGICHGGFIFTLADTTFAYACNARNRRAVAQSCSITFLQPAAVGSQLFSGLDTTDHKLRDAWRDVVEFCHHRF